MPCLPDDEDGFVVANVHDSLPQEDEFATLPGDDDADLDAKASKGSKSKPRKAWKHGLLEERSKAKRIVKDTGIGKTHATKRDSMDSTHMRTLWSARLTGRIPGLIANSVPRDDFMEIFSPPRIAPLLQAMGFRSEVSVDIDTGYDCMNKCIKREVNIMMEHRRPRVVHLSSPCTVFSKLMAFNRNKMAPDVWNAKYEHGSSLLDYSMQIAGRLLAQDGRGGVHIWPPLTYLIMLMFVYMQIFSHMQYLAIRHIATDTRAITSATSTRAPPRVGRSHRWKQSRGWQACSPLTSTSACSASSPKWAKSRPSSRRGSCPTSLRSD